MIKVKRVDHVGVVVNDMERSLPLYSLLGLEVAKAEYNPARSLKIAFLPAGECEIELLEPGDSETISGRFLAQHGEGLYHICLAVEDIDTAVQELTAAGIRMIDEVPRRGSLGRRIAFVDPGSTHGAMVELLED